MAANSLLAESQINVLTMRYHLESIHTESLTKTAGYADRISEHCTSFQKIVAKNPKCVHYNLTLHGEFCLNGIKYDAIADKDYSQTTLLVFALQQDAPLSIFQALLDVGAEIAPQKVRSITCPRLNLFINIDDVNAFITLALSKDRRDILRELLNRKLLTEDQTKFIVASQVTTYYDTHPSESFSSASPRSNNANSSTSIILSSLSSFFAGGSSTAEEDSKNVDCGFTKK